MAKQVHAVFPRKVEVGRSFSSSNNSSRIVEGAAAVAAVCTERNQEQSFL